MFLPDISSAFLYLTFVACDDKPQVLLWSYKQKTKTKKYLSFNILSSQQANVANAYESSHANKPCWSSCCELCFSHFYQHPLASFFSLCGCGSSTVQEHTQPQSHLCDDTFQALYLPCSWPKRDIAALCLFKAWLLLSVIKSSSMMCILHLWFLRLTECPEDRMYWGNLKWVLFLSIHKAFCP